MLDEAVDIMLKPRMCANGIPVPVNKPLYRKTAGGLRTVAKDMLKAAQAKDRDRVIELAEPLADACAACHQVYRDPEGPRASATRRFAARWRAAIDAANGTEVASPTEIRHS